MPKHVILSAKWSVKQLFAGQNSQQSHSFKRFLNSQVTLDFLYCGTSYVLFGIDKILHSISAPKKKSVTKGPFWID